MLMPVAIWVNINGPEQVQQEEVVGQGGQVDLKNQKNRMLYT